MGRMTDATSTATSTSTSAPAPTVWPTLRYRDAVAAIGFLTEAFGFEEVLVVPGERDGEVAHAELRWPEGGGVMLGTADRPESVFSQGPTGVFGLYVVTDRPDELHARAVAAGAAVVRGLEDHDYGSREFAVRDLEGNLWSFGTYRGSA
jgi:uncharacterized glyoxalase superfamily protein PhnB